MTTPRKSNAKRCCAAEHERLLRRLVACDLDATSSAERHDCYRPAARTSGRRSRTCMTAE